VRLASSTYTILAAAAATILFAGGSLAQDEKPIEADPAIVALVPEEFRGKELPAAIGDAPRPMYYRDDTGQLLGVNKEFADAVGAKMGVTFAYDAVPFSPVIPGLQSGRYVAAFFGFEASAEREEIIDIVAYYNSGVQLVMPTALDRDIGPEFTDLCGENIGGLVGANGMKLLEEISADVCVAGGLEPITISAFPDSSSLQLAALGGRVDSAVLFKIAAAYLANTDPRWKLTGPKLSDAISGHAVAKDSGLRDAFLAAITALVEDGTYQRIAAKHQAGMETFKPVLNPFSQKK